MDEVAWANYNFRMLLGRQAELARTDALVAMARGGGSGALLVVGEPGIGKSALLRDACDRASGMVVFRGRGFEEERELSFAGLSLLLRPALHRLDEVPEPQRRALAIAMGLEQPAPLDRFAVYGGTLSLLAAAAGEQSLLICVDDVHWLDVASAEALLFVARRLGREGIAMLLASRAGENSIFDAADLPELSLGGLAVDDFQQLLAERAGTDPPADVAREVHEATGGNPLALIELIGLLTPAQLSGSEPLDDPLPTGLDVEKAFGQRIDALPATSQRALMVVAVDPSLWAGAVGPALQTLGLERGLLESAEAADLVILSKGAIEFRHPLIRSVAYHRLPPPERRAAHRALANALNSPEERARRAWHLAAATVEPDEGVAAELEAAAREAIGRGAPTAAARALEVGARLTPAARSRTRRLLDGAQQHHLAGKPAPALRLLDEALDGAHGDPLFRADVQGLRARVLTMTGSMLEASELLVSESERVRPHDESRAAAMLTEAAVVTIFRGELRQALQLAQEAARMAEPIGGMLAFAAAQALSAALVFRGQRAEGRAALQRLEPVLHEADVFQIGAVVSTAQLYLHLEEFERGRELLAELVTRARQEGAVQALPYVLACLAEAEFKAGDWSSAYAFGTESATLAEDTSQWGGLSHCLVRVAYIEAGRGQSEQCRHHAGRSLTLASQYRVGGIMGLANHVLGLLELGLGRLEEAVGQLEEAQKYCSEQGLEEPMAVQWAQDLAEAYIRLSRPEAADGVLARLERQAEVTGGKTAAATAARCRGLMAEDMDEAEAHFARALALHAERPAHFELGRTKLCLGERLRRGRRPREARECLRGALETFLLLGAEPWAEKARRELRASGERGRRGADADHDDLTPQELQVALVVAEGATNREAAAMLYLSPKTIEMHLSHAYRKLGVRSRTELSRRLHERSVSTTDPAEATEGGSASPP